MRRVRHFGHPDAAAITALGLHALQHRGQEAAGIVSFDGKHFHSERRLGLVGDAFSGREVIDRLPGNAAVGHVRYSTTGETILRNVQPLFAELNAGGFAIGHNGNLTNGLTLRRQLVREGAMIQSTTDTEVILHLVARSHRNRFVDRFVEALRLLEGSYAFVALTNKKLVGARDPLGIRPLVLGKLDGCPILASETCALDIIGAQYVRDVETAKWWSSTKTARIRASRSRRCAPRPCIFEYIYFARPDSIVGGRSVYDVRKTMRRGTRARGARRRRCRGPGARFRRACGNRLRRRPPAFPTSSASSAIIMSAAPSSSRPSRSAQLGVRLKHSANRAVVSGKRIVLIDDFDRARHDVGEDRADDARCRRARSAFPHRLAADHASRLLRHRHAGAGTSCWPPPMTSKTCGNSSAPNSLAFLSVEGIYRAMGEKGRDPVRPQFTDHCFTGEYPTPLTDRTAQDAPPRQLSLLAEAS